MPRETRIQRRERADRIRGVLRATYPDAHCELVFRTPLELLVATILSAQCADRQVNRVTPGLFRRFPNAEAYATAPVEDIAAEIRTLGLFRNKARNLREACRALVRHHDGEVPTTLEALTALAGVGRKTANVVLGNAFGIASGIVVDTHVARLAGRLRLATGKRPEHIEQELIPLVPREEWTDFSHQLIWHGRRRCFARRPDCGACELRALCPSMGRMSGS
ncbi:MAG: endonuclease III [Verrucomicrobiae bacterium]|nr:endonuclease III [Verrucomicrobiae bacterium]